METLLPFLLYDFNCTFKMFTVLLRLLGNFSIWGEGSVIPSCLTHGPQSLKPFQVLLIHGAQDPKALSGSSYP